MERINKCPYCGHRYVEFKGYAVRPIIEVIDLVDGNVVNNIIDSIAINRNKTVRCEKCHRKIGNLDEVVAMLKEVE